MTVTEFFEAQSTTDIKNRVIDKFASKYNMFDLIRFAQAYHDNEMRLITNQQDNETRPEPR